jgi:hypothetical protein
MGKRSGGLVWRRLLLAGALVGIPAYAVIHFGLSAIRSRVDSRARFVAAPQPDERGTAIEILSRSPDRQELLEWYRSEKAAGQRAGSVGTGEVSSLEQKIRAADMSALELFAVGASVYSNLDPWSATAWVRVATDKAFEELPADPTTVSPSDMRVRAIGMAMHDSNKPLWATGEGVLLERQCAYNMRLPAGVLYPQVPIWARFGHVEALSVQGRAQEANGELDAIAADAAANPECYTAEQLTEVHWMRSQILSSMGRLAEAIPHLEATADDPRYRFSNSALTLLVDYLCKLGRGSEAERRFQQYVQRGQPDLPTKLMYAALVEDAKYRESGGRTGKPLGYIAPADGGSSDDPRQNSTEPEGRSQ